MTTNKAVEQELPFGNNVIERFYNNKETIFHDTVPLPEEELPEAREKAKKQKGDVLSVFHEHPEKNYTPVEIWEILNSYYQGVAIDHAIFFNKHLGKSESILLTSVRRSISDLTKENRLIKCQWSESKEGRYGKLNRVWRYNTEYVKPLNIKVTTIKDFVK